MRNRPARGATTNVTSSRIALPAQEADGDWLDWRETVDGAEPTLRTSVAIERPRTILSRNASPDIPFDRSINPYRGWNMAASIVSRGRPMSTWTSMRVATSTPRSSSS